MMRRLGWEFACYFLVSVLALGIDMGTLLILSQYTHYILAATIGFSLGSIAHYFLAIRLVFKNRRLAGKARIEGTIYVLAGLGGLAINAVIIYVGMEWAGLALAVAKLFAAGGSFVVGFSIRKLILFRPSMVA